MLRIEAHVTNDSTGRPGASSRVTLVTSGRSHELPVGQKPDGRGLAANGGELLCLALGTCFCNDLYREAAPREIRIERVEVSVRSTFGGAGDPAASLGYGVRVRAGAPPEAIRALIEHTDRVAEVHNTLRRGMAVTLDWVEVEASDTRDSG